MKAKLKQPRSTSRSMPKVEINKDKTSSLTRLKHKIKIVDESEYGKHVLKKDKSVGKHVQFSQPKLSTAS